MATLSVQEVLNQLITAVKARPKTIKVNGVNKAMDTNGLIDLGAVGTSNVQIGTTAGTARDATAPITSAEVKNAGAVTSITVNGSAKSVSNGAVDLGTVGTITGVKVNGTNATVTSGVADLGTVGGVKTVNGTAPDAQGNVVVATSAGSVASTGITDATSTGRSLLTATDSATARSTIGAGTSNLVVGTTSGTAKDGAWKPASTDVSDATATGRSVLTATDAATARTAIGAGTSNLAIGTTSTTAKAGNYAPSTAEVQAAGAVTGIKKNGTTQTVTAGVVDLGTTVSSVTMNGTAKTVTNGAVDLGTAVTSVTVNGSAKTVTNGAVDLGTVGTVTQVKANGSTYNPTSGVVDLGTITGSSTPTGTPLLGMWAPGFPDPATIQAHEQTTGARYSIASTFRGAMGGDWLHDNGQNNNGTNQAARAGYTPLVAWDMGSTTAWNLASWANGSHDAYLDQVIAGARSATDVTVYVRPWAEMNADFSVFQPGGTGAAAGTPAEFISAWRHVVDYIRNANVTNIKWVWCPTTDTYTGTTQDLTTIWPGSTYVDVIGLDGYNWGTGGTLTWRSFEDVYTTQYGKVTALDANLPVWVCETGCKEPSIDDGAPADTAHSKAQWITDMAAALPVKFPRIRAVCWFSEKKERDWRIDSTTAPLHAWQAANNVSATTSGGTTTTDTMTATDLGRLIGA